MKLDFELNYPMESCAAIFATCHERRYLTVNLDVGGGECLKCRMTELVSKAKIIPIVINLEIRKGHLKWSITNIAMLAGVSRSLVYYYFGKTKQEILANALRELVNDFYGLTDEKLNLPLVDSLKSSHASYKLNPSYATFFQRWRLTESFLAAIFIEVEQRYEQRLHLIFPKADANQLKALHGLFHGIVTAPYLDPLSIEAAVNLIDLKTLR